MHAGMRGKLFILHLIIALVKTGQVKIKNRTEYWIRYYGNRQKANTLHILMHSLKVYKYKYNIFVYVNTQLSSEYCFIHTPCSHIYEIKLILFACSIPSFFVFSISVSFIPIWAKQIIVHLFMNVRLFYTAFNIHLNTINMTSDDQFFFLQQTNQFMKSEISHIRNLLKDQPVYEFRNFEYQFNK